MAVAQNGAEGLEIAIDIIPDLIISDVIMSVWMVLKCVK